MKKTAEFVSQKHPDKICDFIADSILDEYLKNDKESRVAVEIMGGHGLITINGEVTSKSHPDLEKLVKEIVGENYKVIINLVLQSREIAEGVDKGGAGDQGIMKGYATDETPEYLPLEYVLARNLCEKIFAVYPYDGKTQVTIEDGKALTVVASFQNTKNDELLKLVKEIIKADEYLINPAGEWTHGGFDADTGLSGRKLVIDNYGPEIPIGGGFFNNLLCYNNAMDKQSKFLIIIFVVFILISIFFTYKRAFIDRNFIIEESEIEEELVEEAQ